MARKNNGPANLSTKTSRAVLPAQDAIRWQVLEKGQLHIGYRRRKATVAGLWLVRRYVGTDERGIGHYNKTTLGSADDFEEANGTTILSFFQAQQKAIALGTTKPAEKTAKGPLTVQDVADHYLKHKRDEGAKPTAIADAKQKLDTFMLELGKLRVNALNKELLKNVRKKEAERPAKLRTAKGKPQRYREVPLDKQPRRSTAKRNFTVLIAALNQAVEDGLIHDDSAWRKLKPLGGKVDAPRPDQYCLTVAESQRLIEAADPESGFRDLVRGALHTGARYGELCEMRVRDFQRECVVIPESNSKNNKPRDIELTDEGIAFFKALTSGRPADQFVFRHADGSQWKKSHQFRPMRAACKAANVRIMGFHGLRHTWASLAVTSGVPLLYVAQNLGHLDRDHKPHTRMAEKHYAHLAKGHVRETIRKLAPRFDGVMKEAAE